jgi:hypothetical protein
LNYHHRSIGLCFRAITSASLILGSILALAPAAHGMGAAPPGSPPCTVMFLGTSQTPDWNRMPEIWMIPYNNSYRDSRYYMTVFVLPKTATGSGVLYFDVASGPSQSHLGGRGSMWMRGMTPGQINNMTIPLGTNCLYGATCNVNVTVYKNRYPSPIPFNYEFETPLCTGSYTYVAP